MTLIFKQLREDETGTYTYIVGDAQTKEIAIIDSVRDHFERYRLMIQQEGWKLRYLLETHVHADHITAAGPLQDLFPEAQIGVYQGAGLKSPFLPLQDGTLITVGSIEIKVLHTPGHTTDDLSFLIDGNRLLTGDTMLINSCGRTDFQAGDSGKMHESLNRLARLAPDTLVYPGHDYQGRFVSSIQEQLTNNKLLSLNRDEFATELGSWNLAPPKRIKESVPGNLKAGRLS